MHQVNHREGGRNQLTDWCMYVWYNGVISVYMQLLSLLSILHAQRKSVVFWHGAVPLSVHILLANAVATCCIDSKLPDIIYLLWLMEGFWSFRSLNVVSVLLFMTKLIYSQTVSFAGIKPLHSLLRSLRAYVAVSALAMNWLNIIMNKAMQCNIIYALNYAFLDTRDCVAAYTHYTNSWHN